MNKALQTIQRYVLCVAGLLALIPMSRWMAPMNATSAALYMLLVVLAAATKWGLAESVFTSIAGVFAFNFFFLPPVGTLTIADPQNWVALVAFLVTAITASKLSSNAKARETDAVGRRNEMAKLYELSRSLLMDEGRDAVRHSILQAAQILNVGEIAFFDTNVRQVYGSIEESQVTLPDLIHVAETGDSLSRDNASVIPVRLGTHVIGSLAFGTARLSLSVRESVAGLLAINYERAHALDRAATAEIARRNEEFKSSLLDGLAHDLKTPLTAIRTCVTRLITIPPRTEEVRQELLSIIDQESLRLQASISEAIELARIESHKIHLETALTDIAALVDVVLSETRDEDRTRYSFDAPRDLAVWVDADLVRRALMQVLENARKYSPAGTPIRIEVRTETDGDEIRVIDHGPGISPDEIDRIFDKFYRGRRGRDKAEGTGMGLAIAKGIIEAHGGRIHAENCAGGGAAIVMRLPHAPASE
jgi:two-component system, OmpR family, sensor histidine kinase KdpD